MEAVDQMKSKETHKRITTQLHTIHRFFFGVVYMYVDPLAQISTVYLAIQSPAL